ncbi:MAG: methionine--tRNA ligase [Candidatus Methanoplasma sp.]|jgi:methionyl-tRNA synthetase|nr:methionine--tRNA ligase [Candidatus Methanoplasma sp.]
MSKICINIAWPYANGPIHLGHVAGSLLPPDIFGRYNRLLGNEVLVVGGSDQHGTPITVTAEREGVTPEAVADRYHEINKKAIEDLDIQYSLFGKTHCDTHIEVTQWMFTELLKNGYLYAKETDQYYCSKCARFLPDRYVEGICPKCGAENVRSDQCDACGATFETGDLLNAHCVHCGSEPDIRGTEHYFLRLSAFKDRLLDFLEDKEYWRPNVKTFTNNWLEQELLDRAVTRDMSWGVPVPIEGWDDKVIYVWFDAVIGYLSDSIEYSKRIGKPDYWERFWKDPGCRHYYFIGKDNIPFHSIIWPSILMGVGGLELPYDIPANEFLMFRGGKLSKSRGGAIDIPSILQNYDKDAVRYYLSVNMPDTHDADFTWEDFQAKVNTELVATLGNFYHRCISFTQKNFGTAPSGEGSEKVREAVSSALEEYKGHLDACDFKKGIRAVMELARFGNRHFDSGKPWALVKTDRKECENVLYDSMRIVKALAVMAWPFLPSSSEKIWHHIGYEGTPEDVGLDAALVPIEPGQKLEEPVPVYKKIEIPQEAEESEKGSHKAGSEPVSGGQFEAFKRLDLRVGRIVSVDDHPDAEKLYVLKVNIGEEQPRQIVAGLKAHYSKEEMSGRGVFVVSNLKPAKLRGIRSEGMLLAADDESLGGNAVLLLGPSEDVPAGTKMDCGLGSSPSRIEYADFLKAVMKVTKRVASVYDGDSSIELSDGKGCRGIVDGDILDGAGVR